MLLHGSVEAVVAAWNLRAAISLDKIVPMQPLLTHHSRPFPWFTEKLQILKRAKRFLECCWRKIRDDSNRTRLRAPIKGYLVTVRVVKQQHFPDLIASSECCPEALFWVAHCLLDQGGLDELLQSQAEEFVQQSWTLSMEIILVRCPERDLACYLGMV